MPPRRSVRSVSGTVTAAPAPAAVRSRRSAPAKASVAVKSESSRPASTLAKRSSGTAFGDEGTKAEPAPKKGRAVSTSKPPSKSKGSQPSKGVEEEEELAEAEATAVEDSGSDGDEGTVTRPNRRDMKKPRTASPEDEDEEEDNANAIHVEAPHTPNAKQRRVPSTKVSMPHPKDADNREASSLSGGRPSSTPSRTPTNTSDDDEEEEQDLLAAAAAMATPRRPTLIPATPATVRSSLLDRNAPTILQEPEPSGPKSRLVIHKMVLINFKSYAGRQEIGPFHKSFSSIVGPNGSGKSNTIDALLFVFGYRAAKMRQGKLSELIHNSADYPDLEYCSVEVHFRDIIDLPGPDAFEAVPNSELVVSRKAFKSNSSTYTINDRNSNFTEVTTLLKGRGIDLDHKRFLILQGEVESIAQMKPKAPTEHEDGLLEYLEDIIGTAKYKQAIEESLAEVDRLNEERGDKLNRLRIVEREKASLEEKKKEAEAYLKDQNELTLAQALLWQFYMWQLRANMEITGKNIDLLERKLKDETERHQEQIKDTEKLQTAYDERLKAFEIVKKETDKLVKELGTHEKEEIQFQEKKKHLGTKAKKLNKSLADDQAAKSTADALVRDKADEIKRVRKEIDEQETMLVKEEAELENIAEGLRGKTEVFNTQIQVKQKELEPWMTQVRKIQSDIDVATNEKMLLEEKAASVDKGVDQAMAAVETMKEELKGKEEKLRQLHKEKQDLEGQSRDGKSRLKVIQDEVDKMKTKVKNLRERSDEARASLSATRSEDAVLESLTKLRDTGRIKGFHGRLGNLGTIADKYDVAVSTACTSLNNLVVDTVEQGQACIDYLRKHNIGRASIIVLEKLPARNLDPIDTPEGVPRLFDLIKPKDPKFAPAFYKGLFNTLVANDLEQANRIAFGAKRWRVVTLAGQLIDTSGTMSGGGNRVAKGGMSSKLAADRVEPSVVARYEKETADAEERAQRQQAELRQAETQTELVQKSIPKVDMAMSKVQLDIKGFETRLDEAQKRAKELQLQNKPDANDAKRVKTLDADIASYAKDLEKVKKKSDAIESDIRDLQEKILEVGGVKLRSQQSKVDGIKQLIDLANERMNKAEVTQAKATKDSAKLEKSIETHTKHLDDVQVEVEALEADYASSASDLQVIRENVTKAEAALDIAKDQLEEMKSDLDEKTSYIKQFRALEMELKQKLDEAGKSLEDSKRKLDHWKGRHEELLLEYVDDDEDDTPPEREKESASDAAESANTKPVPEQINEEEVGAKPEKHIHREKQRHGNEIPIYSDDELQGSSRDQLIAQVSLLEERVQNPPNMSVLAEYRKREANFLERAQDLERVTALRDAEKRRHDELRKTRLEEFMAGFSVITSKLKEMYQMITLGGNAELELVDSMDPFSEGINFSVMPPKKSWKNISNLSGGEKTLSSLALVFALHVFKPTPLYFMDEIDAALDFRNVSIIANYIKDRTKNAQFIIISLRNDMFELSHRLIGIYKTVNATKSIAINNHALTVGA
ncbi:RecF/RecN/SMC protein [Dacryopinax primogenitus]|uniref:Structural maintenance of chromosomes protein n=1 Tax=Dacryopinax primogenitus (strain DJM 731) TaxID=1858805 RepID=M5G1F7_DACPD|nr:RecF/RecN/SMC protein [Dacryopinax primogenitus]EJU02564.1 RecF/RecN/SMC protein [Dacryopinax primogenitus]